MNTPKIIIAIDGFSSSGKSTLAKDIAKHLGFKYIDTGAMYRAVALFAKQNGIINEKGVIDEENLQKKLSEINLDFKNINGENHIFLNGMDVEKEIRTLEISELTSQISKLPFVREFLVAKQREIGKEKGIVMDGRDIGSVVFPDAEVKFFVTASPEVRAKRRFEELKSKGIETTYEQVLKSLQERDKQDTTRKTSPLIKTDDAIEIDNSNLNRQQQLELALTYINERIKSLNF
jgi:cytidylate kinase